MNKDTSMLDDLIAIDKMVSTEPVFGDKVPSLQSQSLECQVIGESDFTPLDLRQLNSGDFAVIVGALMKRLGLDSTIITQSELTCLNAPAGMSTVLACRYSPSSGDVEFSILQALSSEFR